MLNMERQRQFRKQARPIALALAAALGTGGNALAFNIDVDNEDIEMRLDTTVRYNAGVRVKNRNNLIGNNIASDEGTYLFDKGDLVTNRLDLFSEFDFAWKKQLGFRVSGAAWGDGAYGTASGANPKFARAGISSYTNQQFSPYIEQYYRGPSGELLDAFVFANFDVGDVPTKVRAGRHTVFWGESLFLGGALHGISYSQMPLDLQKGFATPGVEAKELFRPLNQVSGQVQVTDTLSLGAQYFLEWEAYRFPEGGTYLGPVDFAFNGPDRILLAPGVGYTRGNPFEPAQRNGEFGLNARWSPEALDGTVGVYYRRYADKLPQGLVTHQTLRNVGTAARPNYVPLSAFSQYNLIYADGIDLRHQPGQEHRRHQLRQRTVLPPQHAAAVQDSRRARHQSVQRPGAERRRDDRTARQHHARPGQRRWHPARYAGLRRRHLGPRTGVEPVARRHQRCRNLPGRRLQGLHVQQADGAGRR